MFADYFGDAAFPRWSCSHTLRFCAQGQEKVRGQRPGLSDIWQKLQPVVDCGDSAMTVTFRRRRASQVLLDLGEAITAPFGNVAAFGVRSFVSDKHKFKLAVSRWHNTVDLWTVCACFVLLICASQRMSHLCRCPGRLPVVATRCRPHGETSGSWLSTTPAMSRGRYDPCGMFVGSLFTARADKRAVCLF